MAGVNASGNIFNLEGQAGFAPGIVRGRVGSRARLDYTARAEICHGADLTANATALAAAKGKLALFLPALNGGAAALAAAGVAGRLQVKPDLFDKFGFSATLSARADASVAAHLALAADFVEISRAAQGLLSGLYMQLFAIFLREVSIEAGAWAQASVAAMIEVHLEVAGSLAEDNNAGFVISAGQKLGWGVGQGVDIYAGVRLDNPRRWYDHSVRLVTAEFVRSGRRILDRSQWYLLDWLHFTLPIMLTAAYDAGQQAAMQSLQPSNAKAATFLTGFMSGFQRTMIEKIAELGMLLLENLTVTLSTRVSGMNLGSNQRALLEEAIQRLTTTIRNDDTSKSTLSDLVKQVERVLAVAPNEPSEPWQRAVSLVWTSIGATDALSEAVGDASFSVGAIGTSPYAISSSKLLLPSHHQVGLVKAEYERSLGRNIPARLSLDQAVDYLINSAKVEQLALDHMPSLTPLLNELAGRLNMTAGAVFVMLLRGKYQSANALPLYRTLRAFLKQSLDNQLLGILVPQLDRSLPRGSDARVFLLEVVQPSLALLSVELLENLDRFVQDGPNASTFLEPLRQSASLVVYKITAKSLVTLMDIFLTLVYDQLERAFLDMARSVQSGGMNNLVATAATSLFVLPVPSSTANASTRQLLVDMLKIAAECNGPRVWTPQRRKRYRELMTQILLSIDEGVDYGNDTALDRFLDDLARCQTIPSLNDVVNLSVFHADVLAQALSIFVRGIGPALTRYYMAVGEELLDQLESAAAVALNAALTAFQTADRMWRNVEAEVRQLQRTAERLADQKAANLRHAQTLLSSSARRNEILAQLERDGVRYVRSATRQLPGFSLQPIQWQRDQLKGAENAFRNTWLMAIRPHVNNALQAIGSVSGGLGSLIANAANLSRLMTTLSSEIRRAVEQQLHAVINFPLVGGLTISSIAEFAANTITTTPVVRDVLKKAMELRREENDAKRQLASKQTVETRKKADRDAKDAAYSGLLANGGLSVTIDSPRDFDSAEPQPYRHRAPLNIRIAGANPSFVGNGSTNRVRLVLNGHPLNVQQSQWVHNAQSGGIALAKTLDRRNPRLKEGINVVECSVTSGRGQRARSSVMFVYSSL